MVYGRLWGWSEFAELKGEHLHLAPHRANRVVQIFCTPVNAGDHARPRFVQTSEANLMLERSARHVSTCNLESGVRLLLDLDPECV